MITLFPTYMLGELRLTSYPYAVEFGGDHGAPETVTELVQSLLADGDIVRVSRQGNREISLVVHVEGASLAELAANEAALRRECAKLRNLLTFEPGDEMGAPASVFEVHVAEMRHPRDDEMEQHLLRRWELTLTCSPHARSLEATTVAALVAGSTTVTVDTCDSATGWTATTAGQPAVASTAWEAGSVGVAELDAEVTSPETWTLTRAGAVDGSATPYLRVEVRTIASDSGATVDFAGYAAASVSASRKMPVLSMRRIPGSVYFEVVFDMTGLSDIAALTFAHVSRAGDPWQGVFIRSVVRSDVPPGVTARQQSRIIEVGGTERTPASIHVQTPDGTGSLSQVIVHTSPEDGSGYSPPLSPYRTSASTGPRTAQGTAYSGSEEPIAFATGGFYAEVPTSALPEGGYVLMARVRILNADGGTATIFWSTSTIFPDSTDQQGFTNGSSVVTFANGDWTLVPLAALSLPSVRTSAGEVQIVLQASTDNPAINLDEAWLFRADDDCAVTIVNTDRPRLWLDSADASSSVPTVWVGDDASSRVHPASGLLAMGHHVLSPDGTAVFTAAYVDNPATDATFYRRWHSNAAD